MSGRNLFLDTNIILYHLNGDKRLKTLFQNRSLYTSIIVEIEFLCFPQLENTESFSLKSYLKDFTVLGVNDEVKSIAIELRKRHNLKIPDAIIAATAFVSNTPLVTADQAFKKSPPNQSFYSNQNKK